MNNRLYIYVIELENPSTNITNIYYVGQTQNLEVRLKNHIRGNNRSARTVSNYLREGFYVKSLKELYEITDEQKKTFKDSLACNLENLVYLNLMAKHCQDNSSNNYLGAFRTGKLSKEMSFQETYSKYQEKHENLKKKYGSLLTMNNLIPENNEQYFFKQQYRTDNKIEPLKTQLSNLMKLLKER